MTAILYLSLMYLYRTVHIRLDCFLIACVRTCIGYKLKYAQGKISAIINATVLDQPVKG